MNEKQYLYSDLTDKIIKCAIEVHKTLGPGFLEYVYEEALCYELRKMNIPYEQQVDLNIYYKDLLIPKKYRADVYVDKKVLVENKAEKQLTPVDEAQLIHYLKATKVKIGLLLNFGAPSLQIKRRIY